MRIILAILFVVRAMEVWSQTDTSVTTIDFVEILDGNREETLYYFENNWKVLREMAIENDYIASYQLFEMAPESGASFDLMLITTYASEMQYGKREEHFGKLIARKGPRRLLNEKQPDEFRRSVFTEERVSRIFLGQ